MRVARPLLACATAVAAVCLAGWSSAARPGAPQALRGEPLRGSTGLRLLVAGDPPVVLDVDSGRVTQVRGIPADPRGLSYVVGVAGRSAVVVSGRVRAGGLQSAQLFAVRGHDAGVTSLGAGWQAAPAADGRSVWIKSYAARGRCTLRQVALDGRVVRGPRAFPCPWTIQPGGELGLVVDGTAVYDPANAETMLRPRPGIVVAAAGTHLVLVAPEPAFAEPDQSRPLTLLDATSGARRELRWPSIVDRNGQGGLDERAVDPRGRYVAIPFGDPAWHMTGNQVTDVWILDTATGKLTHLPGTPAFVSLKRTGLAWTADGRLVMLGHDRRGDFVAVWRPGSTRLAIKRVDLGEGNSGNNFAPLG